jgi:hypothetical protein
MPALAARWVSSGVWELQEREPFGLATPKPTFQRKFSTV